MSWFARAAEAFLSVFAPRRALEQRAVREHLSLMNEDEGYKDAWMAGMRAYGYRSARSDPDSTPFTTSRLSADGELLLELPIMRDRARATRRNDPIGSGLHRTFVRHVSGSGHKCQARTGVRKRNEKIEKYWRTRQRSLFLAENASFERAQRIAAGPRFTDGEVLIKRAKRSPEEPVWFEIVEAERIATPIDASPSDPDGWIRDGVERDADGVIVAYWISKEHPHESNMPMTRGNARKRLNMTKDDFVRCPAGACFHWKRQARPGQSHGEPELHAVLQDIRDLDLLMVASLKRVQISACLAVFLKSSASINQLMSATSKKHGYVLDTDIHPGMIMKLQPGEEVQTLVPNFPVPGLEAFVFMLARRIGAAMGISFQSVLNDWSKASYSAARTQQLEDRLEWSIPRSELTEMLKWVWEQVHIDGVLMGELKAITLDDIRMVQTIAPKKEWIDPQREAAANREKLEMRIITRQDLAAELGGDWEEILLQSLLEEKREIELREELGLPPASQAQKPAPAPAAADEDEDEQEDEDQDEDEDEDERSDRGRFAA